MPSAASMDQRAGFEAWGAGADAGIARGGVLTRFTLPVRAAVLQCFPVGTASLFRRRQLLASASYIRSPPSSTFYVDASGLSRHAPQDPLGRHRTGCVGPPDRALLDLLRLELLQTD